MTLLEEEETLGLNYAILDAHLPNNVFDGCSSERMSPDTLLLVLNSQMKSINFSSGVLTPTERAIVVELKRKQIRDRIQERDATETPETVQDNECVDASVTVEDNLKYSNVYDGNVNCSIEISPSIDNRSGNFSPIHDKCRKSNKHVAAAVQQYAMTAGYKVDASVQTNWTLCNGSNNSNNSHSSEMELENLFHDEEDSSSSCDERRVISPFSNITDSTCNEICNLIFNSEFSINDTDDFNINNAYGRQATGRISLDGRGTGNLHSSSRSMHTADTAAYFSVISKKSGCRSPLPLSSTRSSIRAVESRSSEAAGSCFMYEFKYSRDQSYYDSEIFSVGACKWRVSIIKQQASSVRSEVDRINNRSRYTYQLRLMNLHRASIDVDAVTFHMYSLLRPNLEKAFFNIKFTAIRSAISYHLSENEFFKYVEGGQIKIGVSISVS